jgi:hypothetical protein
MRSSMSGLFRFVIIFPAAFPPGVILILLPLRS